MAEVESAWFRGEGGGIHRMDLPLPEAIADQVTKGYLVRVNADGSPYEPEAAEAEVPPPQSAAKAVWVGYAVRVHGARPDDAEAMTKQDLIEAFSKGA